MRISLIFLAMICVLPTFSQQEQLIIGRTIGMKTLEDDAEVRVFGFVESLIQPVDIPSVPIHVNSGDSMIIDFFNVSQGAPHTIHLHGLDVDQENDGVPGLSFEVPHMEHGYYHFKAPHPGTYLYHCHVVSSIHVQAGMYGLVIVHPSDGSNKTWDEGYEFGHDHAFLMSEIDADWHEDSILDHDYEEGEMNMVMIPKYDPTYFLVNGKGGDQIESADGITAFPGESVFLRFANMGYYANKISLPEELNALVVSSDGRPLPVAIEQNELWVFPGERYGVMIYPEDDLQSSLQVDYLSLNNMEVQGSQMIPIYIDESQSMNRLSSSDFEVFPNPANEQLNFNFQGEQIETLAIYNIAGSKVFEARVNANSGMIELSHLEKGTYTLRIKIQGHERPINKLFFKL